MMMMMMMTIIIIIIETNVNVAQIEGIQSDTFANTSKNTNANTWIRTNVLCAE